MAQTFWVQTMIQKRDYLGNGSVTQDLNFRCNATEHLEQKQKVFATAHHFRLVNMSQNFKSESDQLVHCTDEEREDQGVQPGLSE